MRSTAENAGRALLPHFHIIIPVIQMAFTTIPYPGFTIIPHVKFHVYSAPIWIANSTNFISIAIIVFGMKELPRKPKTKKRKFRLFALNTYEIFVF